MQDEINKLLTAAFAIKKIGEGEKKVDDYIGRNFSATDKAKVPTTEEANQIMQQHGMALRRQMEEFDARRNGNDG